uniref:Uncharacterized protein n=1 Tax=Lactuca sativa TaxID=4236 RepID=A0A9R1UJB0_LACSA|nr:hypothetical protein LSAT_V11C900494390 [Lactuca sativa]
MAVFIEKMPNFYGKNLNEGDEFSMGISTFFTERVYGSLNELMGWVQNKIFSLGYVMVRRRSKKNENGMVSYVTLICDRGDEYKIKATSKNSGTKKINCPFKLVGSYIKQFDGGH